MPNLSAFNFIPLLKLISTNFNQPTTSIIPESALLSLDNLYHYICMGSLTVLIPLDLSAAFDAIDHSILLNRLQTSNWLYSCLVQIVSQWTKPVFFGGSKSSATSCYIDVPQMSMLCPILFTHFNHTSSTHGQLIWPAAATLPRQQSSLMLPSPQIAYSISLNQFEQCLAARHVWFCYNRLALNLTNKTPSF